MLQNKKLTLKVGAGSVLIILIILAFIQFTVENKERIAKQNARYIEEATVQTAKRVDETLVSAKGSINMVAGLYGQAMTSPEINFEELSELAENAPFDDIEFVNSDGIYFNNKGEKADVSDSEYYIQGMKGKSGLEVILDPRISNENLVIFYAPLRYRGEIIGVLTGLYREKQMRQILKSTFFGEDSHTLLSLSDGTVFASSAKVYPSKIQEYFEEEQYVVLQEKVEQMAQKASDGEILELIFDEKLKRESACMVKLAESDWLIFQTFPSKVTNQMTQNANGAGITLEVVLILSFLAYIVVLVVLDNKQRKKLLHDNKQKTLVIEGTTQLFERFALVDLENNTYRYLAGTAPINEGISAEGDYSKLAEFIMSRLSVEERQRIGDMVKKDWIIQHMKKDVPHLRYEYSVAVEEGKWECMNIICLERKKGTPVRILLARQDVTDLKVEEMQARNALQEAYRAAEEANRAKSDFLSRMSHDIRTPMNAIIGMTTIAGMHVQEPERVQDCLNKITVSSRHLMKLINEVLDMAKIESGKISLIKERFNLAETIEELITMIYPQVEEKKQHFIVNNVQLFHENVIGDSQRLQQVFLNIVGNAVKFTPEGGTISLKVREKPSQYEGRGCYEFIFEDTGIGMEEKFLDKIFEPFARAYDSRVNHTEGTGLGMPIAMNIVEMMNGSIEVESELNKGSRFIVTVYLRIWGEQKETTKLAAGKGLTVESAKEVGDSSYTQDYSGRRILLVEDNELNMEIADELLQSMGITVDKAYNGREAVNCLLAQPADTYDLVFMDIQMPQMNGYDATAEIRASGRKDLQEIPIIAITADAFVEDIQKAETAGMNGHLSKPIELVKLSNILKLWIPSVDDNEKSEEKHRITVKECYKRMGADYEDAFNRLKTDERIQKYLGKLAEETILEDICKALEAEDYETAFRSVHSLKGVCMNLGLTMLSRTSSVLCEALRGGKPSEDITPLLQDVKQKYEQAMQLIAQL